jgi:hypothetical protein
MLQVPERGLALLFRVNANPVGYFSSVRAIIRQLDSTVALAGVSSFDHQVNDSIGIVRIMGTLMGVFGVVALALSAVEFTVYWRKVLHNARARLAFASHSVHVLAMYGGSSWGTP